MSFRPDTIERKLARLEKKSRELRDEVFFRSRGSNATLTGGISVGAGARGGTGSFQAMRSFIPQDIIIDDLDENQLPTGILEHITLGAGAFLRVSPPAGIAGNLKFIHGALQDGQFLILTPNSTQAGSTLRLKTGGNISIATEIVLQRNEIAVLIFDETLTINDPTGEYMVLSISDGGGGVACPIICKENDIGEVSGVVNVDWSIANFHRAILIGDTTFNFFNTPSATDWQDICLEVQQDIVGGHSVSFVQGMANNFIPKAISGANRYTSWQIYTYEEPAGANVFQAFDKAGTNGPNVPGGGGQFQGFAGFIQAKLAVDQTTSLGIFDHIEFQVIVDNDKITVSGGVGQLRGVFSGFQPGHVYQCEVYLAAEGATNQLNFAAKWFDRNGSLFIGTEGVLKVGGAVNDIASQQVGKAFFRATSLADSLEVQITGNANLSAITDGSVSDEPTCFAVIKDCGITEETLNQPEPPPTEGELDIREFIYLACDTESSAQRFANFQSNGRFNSLTRVDEPIIRNMRIKNIIIRVSTKGANDRSFNYEADGVQRGPLFIIPGGFTGTLEFPNLDIALGKDELIGMTSVGGTSGDRWSLSAIVWYL